MRMIDSVKREGKRDRSHYYMSMKERIKMNRIWRFKKGDMLKISYLYYSYPKEEIATIKMIDLERIWFEEGFSILIDLIRYNRVKVKKIKKGK